MDFIVLISVPLFCLAGFLHIWRIESRSALILTPFLVLMINEFVRIMPAFVYASVVGISDTYPLLVFFTGYLMLIVGFLFSISNSQYRSGVPRQFVKRNIDPIGEKRAFFVICIFSAFLILAGMFLYQGLPPLIDGLTALVKGDDLDNVARYIGSSRKDITKSHVFGGSYRFQGFIRALQSYWWPFIIALAISIYLKKKKRDWLLISLVLIFFSFAFIAGDGTRSPFIKTFIIYIILYSYVKNVSLKTMATGFVFIVFFAIFMSLYSPKMGFILGHQNFFIDAIIRIFSRIFIGNSINDVFAIEFIRENIIEYRMGDLHLRDLIAAIPGAHGGVPFAHELYLLMNPAGQGTTYATGTYLTKAYVDFGIIGVGIIYFFIGLGVGIAQRAIFRLKKNQLNLVLISMLSLYLGFIVLSGPISTGLGLGFVLVAYVFSRIFLMQKHRTIPATKNPIM